MTGNYVGDLMDELARDPTRTMLYWQGEPVSARALSPRLATAANGLRSRLAGCSEQPVVGLLTITNTPGTLLLRYAANLVGATAVHLQTANAVDPLDRIDIDALRNILNTTRPALLAVDADHVAAARTLCGKLAEPPGLVGFGALGDDILDLSVGPGTRPAAEDVDPGLPATVTYTSGTTGVPKGVAVSFGVRRMALRGLPAHYGTVYLSTLPLSHTSGAVTDMALAAGGSVVLHPGFDAGAVLAAVARHAVTRMTVSPPQLYALENALLAHPDVRQAAVFGVTDENRVEYVHAVVVPRSRADVPPGELIRHVSQALSPNHAPVSLRFRTELPLNEAGKPDKKVLR